MMAKMATRTTQVERLMVNLIQGASPRVRSLAWHFAAIADFGTLATNMEKYRTIQSCKNQIGLVALPRFLPILYFLKVKKKIDL